MWDHWMCRAAQEKCFYSNVPPTHLSYQGCSEELFSGVLNSDFKMWKNIALLIFKLQACLVDPLLLRRNHLPFIWRLVGGIQLKRAENTFL